jgi:hypothetical protein
MRGSLGRGTLAAAGIAMVVVDRRLGQRRVVELDSGSSW